MKKLLLSLSAIICCVTVSFASSQQEIVKEAIEETNRMLATVDWTSDSTLNANIKSSIDSALTVAADNLSAFTIDDDTSGLSDNTYDLELLQSDLQKNKQNCITAILGISVTFLSIIAIIALCLIYNYKRRTAKYSMIEKAIENNYTIPEGLVSEQSTDTFKTIRNIFSQWQGSKPSPIETNIPKEFYSNPLKWRELNNGLILIAVGVALILAFGFNFMGALCSVVVFIGIGKIISNYLQVRDIERLYMAQSHNTKNESAADKSTGNNTPETDSETDLKPNSETDNLRYAPEELRCQSKQNQQSESIPPEIPEQ